MESIDRKPTANGRARSHRSFRPLQEGYTPREGPYAVITNAGELPKAPKGGTGETPVRSTSTSSSADRDPISSN